MRKVYKGEKFIGYADERQIATHGLQTEPAAPKKVKAKEPDKDPDTNKDPLTKDPEKPQDPPKVAKPADQKPPAGKAPPRKPGA